LICSGRTEALFHPPPTQKKGFIVKHEFLKGKESEEALSRRAGVAAKMHHNISKTINILKPYLHFNLSCTASAAFQRQRRRRSFL